MFHPVVALRLFKEGLGGARHGDVVVPRRGWRSRFLLDSSRCPGGEGCAAFIVTRGGCDRKAAQEGPVAPFFLFDSACSVCFRGLRTCCFCVG